MRCKTCHYSLSGLSEHRCPECGRAFDPNDPNTVELPTKARYLGVPEWSNMTMLLIFSGVASVFLLVNYIPLRGTSKLLVMVGPAISLLVVIHHSWSVRKD